MVALNREALVRDLLTLEELRKTLSGTIEEKGKGAEGLRATIKELKENIAFLKTESPIVLLSEYGERKRNLKMLTGQAATLLKDYEVLKTRLNKANQEYERIVQLLETQFGKVFSFEKNP